MTSGVRACGPITVRVTGDVSQTMVNDLSGLLGRIRDEARIDIPDIGIIRVPLEVVGRSIGLGGELFTQ